MNTQSLYDGAIEALYINNPYHNFQHGNDVGDRVMGLIGYDTQSFIHPARMSGKGHDAGHKGGTDEGHEERANEHMQRLLCGKGFQSNYRKQVAHYIEGTVFSKRGELETHDQMIIADADIALIGGEYMRFLEDSARLLVENNMGALPISDEDILIFFRETQNGFFSYLTNITQDESNPFLTKEALVQYPNFSKNKDELAKDVELYPTMIISIVRRIEKMYI